MEFLEPVDASLDAAYEEEPPEGSASQFSDVIW